MIDDAKDQYGVTFWSAILTIWRGYASIMKKGASRYCWLLSEASLLRAGRGDSGALKPYITRSIASPT